MKKYKKVDHLVVLRTSEREGVDDPWKITEKLLKRCSNRDRANDYIRNHSDLENCPTENDNGDHWLVIKELIIIDVPKGAPLPEYRYENCYIELKAHFAGHHVERVLHLAQFYDKDKLKTIKRWMKEDLDKVLQDNGIGTNDDFLIQYDYRPIPKYSKPISQTI